MSGGDEAMIVAAVVVGAVVTGAHPSVRGLLFRGRSWWWRQRFYDPGGQDGEEE